MTYSFTKSFSKLFFLISIFLLIYTIYKSEFYFDESKFQSYFKYYVISLLGVVFWGLTIFLKDETRSKIILVTVSILFTIYSLEILLNYINIPKKIISGHDLRNKYHVYKSLKKQGLNPVLQFHLKQFVYTDGLETKKGNKIFPLGGISNRATIVCKEYKTWLVEITDKYGFNNNNSDWEEKNLDWLLLGDSFAQGQCVDRKDNIAEQIKLITGGTVLNLGHSSNGPILSLASLKEYAALKKPKKVALFYYEENDLFDLEKETISPLLTQYLNHQFSQNLINRQKEIDTTLQDWFDLNNLFKTNIIKRIITLTQVRNYFFYNISFVIGWKQSERRIWVKDFEDNNTIYKKNTLNLFSEVLKKINQNVKSLGGELYFVYLPNHDRYSMEIKNHDNLFFKNKVLNISKKIGIKTIDIHKEVFKKHSDPLSLFPFRNYAHYNPEGYKLIANTLIKVVNKY